MPNTEIKVNSHIQGLFTLNSNNNTYPTRKSLISIFILARKEKGFHNQFLISVKLFSGSKFHHQRLVRCQKCVRISRKLDIASLQTEYFFIFESLGSGRTDDPPIRSSRVLYCQLTLDQIFELFSKFQVWSPSVQVLIQYSFLAHHQMADKTMLLTMIYSVTISQDKNLLNFRPKILSKISNFFSEKISMIENYKILIIVPGWVWRRSYGISTLNPFLNLIPTSSSSVLLGSFATLYLKWNKHE